MGLEFQQLDEPWAAKVGAVALRFSDGSVQEISLADTSTLQSFALEAVTTSFVRLEIVIAHGFQTWQGRGSRDSSPPSLLGSGSALLPTIEISCVAPSPQPVRSGAAFGGTLRRASRPRGGGLRTRHAGRVSAGSSADHGPGDLGGDNSEPSLSPSRRADPPLGPK